MGRAQITNKLQEKKEEIKGYEKRIEIIIRQLRRFALRFIHSHGDASGVFRTKHSWEIIALTTSGNRVRHIVSSQDDAVAGLLGRRSRLTENKEY